MKQRPNPEKKLAVLIFLLVSLLAGGCAKEDEEQNDKIEITPITTQAVGVSHTPLPDTNMPLSPMETWCESMMVKPDREWTMEEAKKFSRQCLYNE